MGKKSGNKATTIGKQGLEVYQGDRVMQPVQQVVCKRCSEKRRRAAVVAYLIGSVGVGVDVEVEWGQRIPEKRGNNLDPDPGRAARQPSSVR